LFGSANVATPELQVFRTDTTRPVYRSRMRAWVRLGNRYLRGHIFD
jgi:hypothetical protein